MISRRIFTGFALVLATSASSANAQQGGKFEFTIRNLMRGPEVFGRAPSNVRWTLDGQWIYFNWLEPGSDWRLSTRQFRVRAQPGAKPERVTGPVMDVVFGDDGTLSPDGRTRLLTNGTAIAVVNASGAPRILTQTLDPKGGVKWSADGREVLYVSANNAFAMAVEGGGVRQLTDLRTSSGGRGRAAGPAAGRGGRGGTGETMNDSTDQRGSLVRQQTDLFTVIRDRAFTDSIARAEGRGGRGGGRGGRGGGGSDNIPGLEAATPRPITLQPGENVGTISVSPTGKVALVTASIPDSDTARQTLVPDWVTASGYAEPTYSRSKVGDNPAPAARLLFVSLAGGNVQTLRLAGDAPAPLRITSNVADWSPSGNSAIVWSSSADFKNRWLYIVNESGQPTLIEALRDSAWVGGPCNRCAGWLDGGRRLYYVSEADGYAPFPAHRPRRGTYSACPDR
jgi:hypothetical protein